MIKIVVTLLVLVLLVAAGSGYYLWSKYTEKKTGSGTAQVTETAKATPEPTQSTNLSNDPSYQNVAQKYNLSEKQLQILSTVHQGDN